MVFSKGYTPWNAGLTGIKTSSKGQIAWNKGIKTGPNPEHSKRMKGRKPWNIGNFNPITYSSIHSGMNKLYGKPEFCELCKTTISKRFEWHNINKKYKLKRNDWLRLCNKCHKMIEKRNRNSIRT